jgi:hypothetical protein
VKNRTIFGLLFFLTLIASTVFGSLAENPRQGFNGIFTGLHQGGTLSKATTAPGLSACFLESSRQVFLLGQGGKLLTMSPQVELGNAKWGLQHILERHTFQTGAGNVSKFSQGMGFQEIKTLISEAAQSGAGWVEQGSKRVLNVNLGKVIGTDQAGNAVTGIRVVTDAFGKVITTYPISMP